MTSPTRSMGEPRRTGRRPGGVDSRAAVLDAARAAFAERGFEGATIRHVAGRAGVDPALVLHFFGSKLRLFSAAMEIPIDPTPALRDALDAAPEEAGLRLARFALAAWERPATRARLVAVLRAAGSDAVAADLLREILGRQLLGPLAEVIGGPDGELRAALIGSQMAGMVLARYVLRVRPLSEAPPEALVGWLAPVLQRYLFEAPHIKPL